jgi:transcriptional regulator with XRE-family HTH domain
MGRFARLLRDARARRQLSQEDVARLVGYKHGAYARVERGEVENPEPARLGRLSQELGIPIIEMFRAAGWLAESANDDAELAELWARIPTGDRRTVLKIIRQLAGAPDGERLAAARTG